MTGPPNVLTMACATAPLAKVHACLESDRETTPAPGFSFAAIGNNSGWQLMAMSGQGHSSLMGRHLVPPKIRERLNTIDREIGRIQTMIETVRTTPTFKPLWERMAAAALRVCQDTFSKDDIRDPVVDPEFQYDYLIWLLQDMRLFTDGLFQINDQPCGEDYLGQLERLLPFVSMNPVYLVGCHMLAKIGHVSCRSPKKNAAALFAKAALFCFKQSLFAPHRDQEFPAPLPQESCPVTPSVHLDLGTLSQDTPEMVSAEHFHLHNPSLGLKPTDSVVNQLLRETDGTIPAGAALLLGGSGFELGALFHHPDICARAVLIDRSTMATHLAQRMMHRVPPWFTPPSTDIIKADVLEAPWPESANIVIARRLLGYLQPNKRKKLLQKIREVILPGGKILLEEHLQRGEYYEKWTQQPGRPIKYFYPPDGLQTELIQAGLSPASGFVWASHEPAEEEGFQPLVMTLTKNP